MPRQTRQPRRLAVATVLACLLGLAATAGCSQDSGTSDSATDKPSSTPETSSTADPNAVLKFGVTFKGKTVAPNGMRVPVALGQPVRLLVTADKPGTIHVHSRPEQELDYPAGTSTLKLDPITVPGIVDIESHDLDKIILQLEVS